MTKRRPAYAPLVNKHLRFYFSNPERTHFETSVDEKQFKAVSDVVKQLTPRDFRTMQAIIKPRQDPPVGDSYIGNNIEEIARLSNFNSKGLYSLFNAVSKNIAIQLEYIPRERRA